MARFALAVRWLRIRPGPASTTGHRPDGCGRRQTPAGRHLATCLVVSLIGVLLTGCGSAAGVSTSGDEYEGSLADRFGWVARYPDRHGDPFSEDEINRGRWSVYDGPGNFGVGLRRPSAVTIEDGCLTIRARGDVSGGVGWIPSEAVTYGRWEFRARADEGTGYSPAVLLWPDSNQSPPDGEIDILEIPNGDRSSMNVSVHNGPAGQMLTKEIPGDFTEWHVFALEWMPNHITVYVDGRRVFRTTDPSIIPRQPMHLAIQNDVGPYKNWIPSQDESTPPVVGFYVDWVRMYR